ncbi:MAG: Flp pilus assembly complex ATPase component TadA [Candidatus Berkelbacteria bacterium]|nr:MAG: Flp pilus assembly complex ATPase component TadA [Candidatus Berkelbacteria bacterium]QQG51467.1 MAG: Flp pilus assembly complex ATPase component TadA [Candidatus Berkelbacteria bacterium]
MTLHVLPQLYANSTKSFLKLLIDKSLIKPGFSSILGGKYLDEVDRYLLSHHLVDELELAKAYAEFYELPFMHLVNKPIPAETARLLPEVVARKYSTLVYDLDRLDLWVAVGDPAKLQRNAPDMLVKLRQQKGLKVHLSIASRIEIEAALDKIYHRPDVSPRPIMPPRHEELSSKTAPITSSEQPHVEKEEKFTPPAKSPIPTFLKPEHVIEQEHNTEATDVAKIPLIQSRPAAPAGLVKTVEERPKTIDLRNMQIPEEVLNKIPVNVAEKYQIIVFAAVEPKSKLEPSLIKVAAVNPDDVKVREILSYIESRNKVLVDRYRTDLNSFEVALKLYPREASEAAQIVTEHEDKQATAPVMPTPQKKDAEQPSPINNAPKPPLLQPTKPEAHKPQADIMVEKGDGIKLSATDIISRPSEDTGEELQRLAKEQELSLENQNLDRLLKEPVTSPDLLAKVFKNGRIPEIVAGTLFLAIRMKASDVHVEAEQESVRVRFRIDGILHDVIRVPHFLHAPLISRIKILSKMKIDEQRIPQDGRFDVVIDNRQVDLRVSTMPTVHGEKVVMRLLDKSEGVLSLEQLGVTGTNFDRLIENINKPYGIILATGPTGSGKSTTLYAVLTRISKPGVNIITLEDPVEYELPGINQAQVKPGIGFTFAEGLRSVLRQDPNVIMVGEVRDLETAAMATHAALTGHLVLSTLHTNDAAGALPRMINMGVEPFLITSSVNAVVGQRLVRKICDNCKKKAPIPPAVLSHVKKELEALPSGKLKNINLESLVFYKGEGCSQCTDGYKGRIGIYEVLTMSEKIESLAVSKAPASEIKKAAVDAGMITMSQDGLIKALKGITTIDEVLRVTTTQIKELPV